MVGWQIACGFALIFEQSKIYPGQASRVAELCGVAWLGFAYLGWVIKPDDPASVHVQAVTLVFNLAFTLVAGPLRRTRANTREKYVLIPISTALCVWQAVELGKIF